MLSCEGWRRGEERRGKGKRRGKKKGEKGGIPQGAVVFFKCLSTNFTGQIPKFQNSKIPKFQNSKIPKFQNSKIPKFQNSKSLLVLQIMFNITSALDSLDVSPGSVESLLV